ncbi:MAG: hypothetical protein GF328_08235 [Candidatus Latescibacteria bacterium]|nr:hypothetical protein [Candidatus Latescibacterota bacterium]
MKVLAFLTAPHVVGKILRHLGLPVTVPELSPVRSSPLGFALPEEESRGSETDRDDGDDTIVSETGIRPPPLGSASRIGGGWSAHIRRAAS